MHVGWKPHLRAYRDIEGQCALGHMEGEGLDTKSSRLDDELKKKQHHQVLNDAWKVGGGGESQQYLLCYFNGK